MPDPLEYLHTVGEIVQDLRKFGLQPRSFDIASDQHLLRLNQIAKERVWRLAMPKTLRFSSHDVRMWLLPARAN